MMVFAAEYAILRYRPAAWLKVTGEDAGSFLQGQFSQDLRGLAPGESVYGLWLNHKGRIQGDGFVIKASGDAFLILSYECGGEELRARLEAFIVADDVVIEDHTDRCAGLSLLLVPQPSLSNGRVAPATGDDSRRQAAADPTMVQGAAAPTMPDGLPPLLSGAGDGSAFDLFRGRRGAGESWECVFPLTHAAEVERILRARLRSIREPGPAFWLRARITAGIPSVPRDAGPTDLPQEVGLVSAAVSFNKGCYLGQEIMARLKTRGRVRRQLAPVRIQGAAGGLLPLPHDGSPLRLFGTGTSLDDSNRPGVAGRPDGATVARPLGEIRSWVPASGEGGLLPLEPNLALAMLPVDIRFPAQFALSPGRETAIALTAL